ncbi:hypothetical protein [Halobaculum magnesiiphilum]|uniref:Uncharacterized protein n=1 Tax=Halobaculum magnesiiphilum TaxID=1017351 RepID=A0A8T8WCG5_9EURY|nr:hypothetical protein [Halobaculum magnesiiphilum]QZP37511.1 hypothetical protein K6T50_14735 [Halobaculum magnesiiphilum]
MPDRFDLDLRSAKPGTDDAAEAFDGHAVPDVRDCTSAFGASGLDVVIALLSLALVDHMATDSEFPEAYV